MKYKIQTQQNGVAALLTVVIVGVATLIIAFSASILGIGELDMGYTSQRGEEAFSVADGCVEEALRRLRIDDIYTGGSLSLGDNSCIINISGAGGNRSIVVSGTSGDYQKKIQVDITISGGVITITSWDELDS